MWKGRKRTGLFQRIGLGWFTFEIARTRIVAHSGGDLGYRAGIQFAPDLGLGWVILANRSEAPIQNLSSAILKMSVRAQG
jgi:CubicO group peptidase (beta-lactamase class C family)